ncbi:MAG: AsmA family protein [Paludibacteraceae bacterium]|nr:AsmA family protein [Paludibacteraceae bacterium]
MKRALKILGWTLLSIVLAVVLVASIAIYVVFTPERLTPIARQAADKFITCEHEIGEVDLTFFSTFPRFGLRADGLLLINPKAGAQNDTVVEAKHLVATVDVMDFLNNKNLHVHEAILDDATVNFYIAGDGTTNLTDVFVTSPDTAEEDTSAFSLPFDALRVDGLRIKANAITFLDEKDTICASLGQTDLSASANSWEDIFLSLDAQDVCASLKGETYADSLHVTLDAPMAVNLDTMHFAFRRAELAVNEFALVLSGTADIRDSIGIDAGIATKDKWQIQPLLALVPAKFTSALKDIEVDGKVALEADIKGFLGENAMPLIKARLTLEDGEGAYKPLPYRLRDLELDADALLDLNKKEPSTVTIRNLAAKTKDSKLSATGTVNDLMGNMLLDLALKLDANLPDFAYFLPDSMTLLGRAKGSMKSKISLADLTGMRLHKGRISADLVLDDIRYEQDSMIAILPHSTAKIQIPNATPSRKSVNWARAEIVSDKIDFVMGDATHAMIDAPVLKAEVANVLNKEQEYFASLAFDALDAKYDTILADLKASELEAFVSGGQKISAKLKTQALTASMGEELKAKTGSLALEAASRYNKDGENALLKWNPRLKINLKDGFLNLPSRLPEAVIIPSIEFKYSNREMAIDNSRIVLGNSDLELKGNVRNIGKWFRHEDILQGELEVVSNHCDANQLLAWFSADKGAEEETTQTSSNQDEVSNQAAGSNTQTDEADPFLVPTDVDLTLSTHMREVEIFNQNAKDLKGGIYVKNGKLILDEVGFVCRAAKLQLTAIYSTPRRNHLYLGFDYHMIDVDIDELLSMIPDLEEMVPMLASFKGAAQFHLAVETYLNEYYKPKMSTLRGASSLTGKDLVVLDSETFSTISKLLMFKKKTENKIDSLNAEITIYKNEIDVYPLCVQMDNYMVALGGRHRTDMTFNYDINVLSPIYLGVHVGGTMDNLQIKLAKCKYAQDFKPHWYQKADTQSLELRQLIKKSMEKNVRIQ